jgi:hypothetical protein
MFIIWWTPNSTYLLGYNAVKSVEIQLTFRENISLPSSDSNKPSKKPAWKQVPINLEDGSDMFVGWLSTDYKALYPRRQQLFITTAVRTSNPDENLFRNMAKRWDVFGPETKQRSQQQKSPLLQWSMKHMKHQNGGQCCASWACSIMAHY